MTVKWTTPSTESSSLVTTELDSLGNGSESSSFTLDNSSNLNLYSKIRLELGSITPGTNPSVTLNIYGPNADIGSTPFGSYTSRLASGASAKTVEWVIQIPPFALEATITNNSGVTFNASNNDIYQQDFNEQDV